MRIIHCDCEVSYTGRGDTTLLRSERVIILKKDGAVMIHSDEGIKPLNYMTSKPKITQQVEKHDEYQILTFENNKELLTITIYRIFSDNTLHIHGDEPGLIHDGTEDQLQEWLSNNLEELIPHYRFIQREFNTDNGPVDLLAYNIKTNNHVLIEVKRTATTAAIHQLKRYIEGVKDDNYIINPERLLIAFKVAPKAREKALKINTPWIELEKDNNNYKIKSSSQEGK